MAVDTIGIKRFLQRTRTLAEIKAISEKEQANLNWREKFLVSLKKILKRAGLY